MKNTILPLILILSISLVHSQATNEAEIRLTLSDYIEGSSYNNLDQIKKAFFDDATLYLTDKDGEFKKYTPQQYADFFKHREQAKFNGRVGKILDVKIDGDIATAKAEIVIEKRKTKYVDLFLLKNIHGKGWKIISKTATLTNY